MASAGNKREIAKGLSGGHKRVALMILAIALMSLVTANSMFQLPQVRTIRWHVSPGLTMTYSVRVMGSSIYSPEENPTSRPPPFSGLNNSFITVNITSLPDLDNALDGNSFTELVVDALKTQQVGPVQYVNGTEAIDPRSDFLNTVVSRCTLPVGAWSILDSYYPDRPEPRTLCNTYISEMDSDGFLIGYRLFDSDAGNGWDGLVSTETGIPFTLSVWAFQHYGDVWYDYFILLRLMC